MKINLNKIILTIGFCAFTAVASADDQMSDMNTNMNGDRMNGMNGMANTPQGFVSMAAMTDMKEIHMGEMALQKSSNSDVKSYAKDIISDHKKACKKLQAIADKEGLNFPETNSMAMNMDDRMNNGMNSMNNRWHTNSMNDRWHTNYNSENTHPDTEKQSMDSPPHLASLLVTNNMNGSMDDNHMDGHSMAGRDRMMNWDSMSGEQFDRAFVNHMVMGHEKAISKFEMASANLQDPDLKKYAEKTLPTLREHLRMAQKLQSKVGNWSNSDMTNSMSQNYRNR